MRGGVIGFVCWLLFVWLNFDRLFGVICSMGTHCPTPWENFISSDYIVAIVYLIPATVLGCVISYLYGKFKNQKKIITNL